MFQCLTLFLPQSAIFLQFYETLLLVKCGLPDKPLAGKPSGDGDDNEVIQCYHTG